jgi:hypothetical protein
MIIRHLGSDHIELVEASARLGEDQCDLAPLDRTRSDVCHAAAFMSISAWA